MKILIALSLLLLAACTTQSEIEAPQDLTYNEGVVYADGNKFLVEIPTSQEGFMQGLMFREELGKNEGMLFPFQTEDTRRFWMKNTLIPLDIIFIHSNGTINTIHQAVPCEADPCEIYASDAPSQFVLEIKGGLAEELGIEVGDKVEI